MRNKLAEEAAKIEIDILKRPIGKQDHYAAAGSINLYKFYANGNVSIMPVDENSNNVKVFENLYTFYTGVNRDASKVLKIQKNELKTNLIYLKSEINQKNCFIY